MSRWLSRSIAGVGTLTWLVGMLLVGAALLAKHVVALPVPSADDQLARSAASLRAASDRGQWLAIHVLYAECRCSQRIVHHLVSSARPAGVHELVLWVGNHAPASELTNRLRVRSVTASQLAQMGISAAPLLILLDPEDHLRYVGGYSERKQGPQIDDLRILASARQGRAVAAHPLFGCAVSERLKQQLTLLRGL